MKKLVKSKFSNNTIYWGIFMLFLLIPCSIFIVKSVKNYNFSIGDTLFTLLFILIFCYLIIYLKQIKYILIEDNELVYYSILHPFGKKIDLNEFIGKIILKEIGSGGAYKVIYLVNKKNITTFKIMELHYKNFDLISSNLLLKTIKVFPTTLQYFKLLFFEKLNITKW